jgi:hypothetical protein
MINFRRSDLPIAYEPVIVDHHSVTNEHGVVQVPAHAVAGSFTKLICQHGYVVYGISHISPDHVQIVYLSNARIELAWEEYIKLDKNSIGTCFGYLPHTVHLER